MLTKLFIIGIIVVSTEIHSVIVQNAEMAKAKEEGYEVYFA